MKSDIKNKEDIRHLVNTFYNIIRKDDLLGNIFNSHIAEDEWEDHLKKLTKFWQLHLFGEAGFQGNPTQKHIQMDKNLNYSIKQEHFIHWISLWTKTLDNLFAGEITQKAKEKAQFIGERQLFMIKKNRD